MFRRRLRAVLVVLIALLVAGFAWKTREEAHKLVTNPRETRKVAHTTPADRKLLFQDVNVTTADGLKLRGWWVPADAGSNHLRQGYGGPPKLHAKAEDPASIGVSPGTTAATVIIAHGYKDDRSSMLGVAEILHRHGYNVLVPSFRGHDENDGETVTFGLRERADLDAFFQYLLTRPEVDRARIGLFGVSMGGTISIGYTAQNPGIRALVSDCAFSSVSDTVETSIKFFTGLPAFPFAPAIVFWTERAIDGKVADIDAKQWIAKIAPRPVLLLQGGADRVVSADSGRKLFEAAGAPKELWFEPEVGHAEFLKSKPHEFEKRMWDPLESTCRHASLSIL